MKTTKIILISILFVTTLSCAQTTNDDFIGYWTSDKTETESIIWKDKYGVFQYVEWDKDSGQSLEILSLKFKNEKLIVRTRFKEYNWVVTKEFTLQSEFTMNAKITGDANIVIAYKKLK